MSNLPRREEIQKAATAIKAGLTEMSAQESAQIRRRIADIYVDGLWGEESLNKWDHLFRDNLIERETVGDCEAWRWIKGFIQDREVLLLFDYMEGEPIYKIAKGDKVVNIIARIWPVVGQNFYVTDEQLSFLFGYWTDGYLYAVGAAKEWLHHLQLGEIYQMLGVPERTLHTTEMEVLDWGTRFVFHCLYDLDGAQKSFNLTLSETSKIELRPTKHSLSKDIADIQHIHLYQAYANKWVVIKTRNVWLKMKYKALTIEKEWND